MEVYTLDSGEYPKLKQHTRTKRIVLFTSPRTGTQLNEVHKNTDCGAPRYIGYTSNHWEEEHYASFTGTVILGGSSE